MHVTNEKYFSNFPDTFFDATSLKIKPSSYVGGGGRLGKTYN